MLSLLGWCSVVFFFFARENLNLLTTRRCFPWLLLALGERREVVSRANEDLDCRHSPGLTRRQFLLIRAVSCLDKPASALHGGRNLHDLLGNSAV